jgi:hypothetical protein
LAKATKRLHELTECLDDRYATIRDFELAAQAVAAPLSCRIAAASAAVDLLLASGDQAGARTLAGHGIELLRLIQPLQGEPQHPEKMLSRYRGLTSRVGSLSIACGDDAYVSLQSSKIGRAILAGKQIDRFYKTQLENFNPCLAKRLDKIRDQMGRGHRFSQNRLETRFIRRDYLKGLHSFRPLFRTARHTLDENLAATQPRITPGNALKRCSNLTLLATDGPVVVFHISEIRCDDILITSTEISTLHLYKLDHLNLQGNTKALIRATETVSDDYYFELSVIVTNVLQWLWDGVVELVLKLGFTETPGEDEVWPRVWWVSTGVLSIFPIHVPGYHGANPPRTAMDRVVSSYVSTDKAPAYARTCSHHVEEGRKPRAMLVAMRETPNRDDIPSTDDEIVSVF